MSRKSIIIDRPEIDLIPTFTSSKYKVTVGWGHLQNWINDNEEDFDGINLDPDFQRGHVWTENQQIAYIEFMLRGGKSSYTLYWNHPDYIESRQPHCNLDGVLVLVDGKQRLTTILKFLKNELKAFGYYLSEYGDDAKRILRANRVEMAVNDLQTREELLKWYLDLNDGGVVHSTEEILRVRYLLAQ